MRLFLLSMLMLLQLNCKSKKNTIEFNKTAEKRIFNLENCATDTQCAIEIISNSNLRIALDEQGKNYIQLEKGDNTIVKYEFKKDEPPNTMDAHYSEMIYFEIDKNDKHLFLTNEALQNVKMIYARFCYCKDGTSGYFKVTQGRLNLVKNDNELSIHLNFKVGKIPQLLTEIKEIIKLNSE